MKKFKIFILGVFLTRTAFGMDVPLFNAVNETALKLASKVLKRTLIEHIDSLVKKDFTKTTIENLGEVNYCACAIVRKQHESPEFKIEYMEHAILDKTLQIPKHSTNNEGIVVFSSKESSPTLESGIKTAFDTYYSVVFQHSLTRLFPTGEFRIRKSDSEQKMLYALESAPIMSKLGMVWKDPFLLAYTGGTLCIVYC
jgi:hypothetical protein